MKSYLKSLRRQDGFTLVELMVVVAIIGLLSAVAVPNFKKYQAKAKMSEAKLQLSSLYTAESSFYSDFNLYHNCLPYMGFDPGPESANRYYAVGITATATINTNAMTAAVNSGLNTAAAECPNGNTATSGGIAGTSPNNATWFPAGKGIGSYIAAAQGFIPTAETAVGAQGAQTDMTFTAGAGGVISVDKVAYGTPGSSSYLTITQAKVLLVLRNGF